MADPNNDRNANKQNQRPENDKLKGQKPNIDRNGQNYDDHDQRQGQAPQSPEEKKRQGQGVGNDEQRDTQKSWK